MQLKWENGAEITVGIDDGIVVLRANREGLLSLANHFAALAQEMPGSHLHLDDANALEDGSAELIVERVRSFDPEERSGV